MSKVDGTKSVYIWVEVFGTAGNRIDKAKIIDKETVLRLVRAIRGR